MATKIKAISHQINIVSLKPLGYMSLEAGASHITPLLNLVEEIIGCLKVTSILDSYDSDAARFVSGYRRLYGQGGAAPTI